MITKDMNCLKSCCWVNEGVAVIVEEENKFTEFLNFDADMENTREGQMI